MGTVRSQHTLQTHLSIGACLLEHSVKRKRGQARVNGFCPANLLQATLDRAIDKGLECPTGTSKASEQDSFLPSTSPPRMNVSCLQPSFNPSEWAEGDSQAHPARVKENP